MRTASSCDRIDEEDEGQSTDTGGDNREDIAAMTSSFVSEPDELLTPPRGSEVVHQIPFPTTLTRSSVDSMVQATGPTGAQSTPTKARRRKPQSLITLAKKAQEQIQWVAPDIEERPAPPQTPPAISTSKTSRRKSRSLITQAQKQQQHEQQQQPLEWPEAPGVVPEAPLAANVAAAQHKRFVAQEQLEQRVLELRGAASASLSNPPMASTSRRKSRSLISLAQKQQQQLQQAQYMEAPSAVPGAQLAASIAAVRERLAATQEAGNFCDRTILTQPGVDCIPSTSMAKPNSHIALAQQQRQQNQLTSNGVGASSAVVTAQLEASPEPVHERHGETQGVASVCEGCGGAVKAHYKFCLFCGHRVA